MPERPSYIPPENPFRSDEGKHPPEPTRQFVERYLGKRGGTGASTGERAAAEPPATLLEPGEEEQTLETPRFYMDKALEVVLGSKDLPLSTYLEAVRAERALGMDPVTTFERAKRAKRQFAREAATLANVAAEAGVDPAPFVQEALDLQAKGLAAEQESILLANCGRALARFGMADEAAALLIRAFEQLPNPEDIEPHHRLNVEHEQFIRTVLDASNESLARSAVEVVPPSLGRVGAMLLLEDHARRTQDTRIMLLDAYRLLVKLYAEHDSIKQWSVDRTFLDLAERFAMQGHLEQAKLALTEVAHVARQANARVALVAAEHGFDPMDFVLQARKQDILPTKPLEAASIELNIGHALALAGRDAGPSLEGAEQTLRALPETTDSDQQDKVLYYLRLARAQHAADLDASDAFAAVRRIANLRLMKHDLIYLATTEAELGYPADQDVATVEEHIRAKSSPALRVTYVGELIKLARTLADRQRSST